jgi:hypothetical protein
MAITTASTTNPNCGSTNGAITMNTPTGGAGGYTYNWTPGNPTGDGTLSVSNLAAGTWTITVTDANGCTLAQNVVLTSTGTPDNATFNYGASAYCVNAADPTPTISGLPGGTFSSSPVGLSINTSTGQIDVSASTPNTYTVTYLTNGPCPNSSNVSVTINALDNASFSYAAASYCPNGIDPTPTITGLAGGSFAATPAGLVLNSGSGLIDLSASSLNTYTVTYTTAGACPNSANVSVTVGDNVQPGITCPGNQTETASANCDFVLPDYTGLATATDNCALSPTLTQLPAPGTIITANTLITLTANDGNGNTSNCTFNVVLLTTNCQGTECANALPVTLNPCFDTVVVTGSTVGGTPTGQGTCGTSEGTGGANWYTFTGDGGIWSASTDNPGSNYDTKLWVFEGACGALNCVTGNDDNGVNLFSFVNFPTTLGTTYYISVGGYSSSEGNYELMIWNQDAVAPVADLASLSDVTAECEVTSLTPPTATDNCAGVVTGTPDVTLPITTQGTTVVIWTYDDGYGNTSSQTQNVVLADVTAAVPDVASLTTITACEEVTPIAPTATDNCSGLITGVPDLSFPITALGSTIINWTYTDAVGNIYTQTQEVIINTVDNSVSVNQTTLTANSTAATYQWIDCATMNWISGATSQSYTASANGQYAVIVTENGCTDTSTCVTINTIGIDELHVNSITFYPNPTLDGMISIQTDLSIKSIEMRDMLGRLVEAKTELEAKTIDASMLNPGTYVIRVQTMQDELLQGTIVIQ